MAFNFNPGALSISKGSYTDTCTVDNDLMMASIKMPEVRQFLEYADTRMVSTLLTSGAVTPYGVKYTPTEMPTIDESKLISDNFFRFNIMGRIQQASEILGQVGSTATDGSFTLIMKDNMLVPGMTAVFTSRLQARVMSYPTGTPGNYIYNFQTPSGQLFSFATDVTPQSGTKTCFGAYSTYGEKSLKGYGRSFTPDTFIVSTTIQRKTIAISGSANADVLWYKYKGLEGMTEGWMYESTQQARAQFMMENEFQKWFGVSTMKNTDKTLRTSSRLIDNESGLQIIAGDGIEEQIAGGNEFTASGSNGEATYNDFSDMVTMILKKSNKVTGINLVCVTGEEGFNNAQRVMAALPGQQSTTLMQTVSQSTKIGGEDVAVGFYFTKLNINGNQVTFIKHPMFNNDLLFTQTASNGKLVQEMTYYFLTLNDGPSNQKNIEILGRGKKGINRAMVTANFYGMTGMSTPVLTQEDADTYAMLKEDLIVVYQPLKCGIIRPSLV